MLQGNILEAKTDLSRLIKLIETGKEDNIIIARYGKPVVKMSIYNDIPVSYRFGIAKGMFEVPADLDQDNSKIAALFEGSL